MNIINMEIMNVSPIGFTIYCKQKCIFCDKIKYILDQKHLLHFDISCDDYLSNDKNAFLSFIENKIGKKHNTFPIVFYDGKYVGGCDDTITFVDNLLLSFDELF
jgi:glutaredoxin